MKVALFVKGSTKVGSAGASKDAVISSTFEPVAHSSSLTRMCDLDLGKVLMASLVCVSPNNFFDKTPSAFLALSGLETGACAKLKEPAKMGHLENLSVGGKNVREKDKGEG